MKEAEYSVCNPASELLGLLARIMVAQRRAGGASGAAEGKSPPKRAREIQVGRAKAGGAGPDGAYSAGFFCAQKPEINLLLGAIIGRKGSYVWPEGQSRAGAHQEKKKPGPAAPKRPSNFRPFQDQGRSAVAKRGGA